MSETKSRIKSKDGLWASCYEFFLDPGYKNKFETEWICSDFVAKIIKAGKKAPEGSELAQCAELIASLKLAAGGAVKIEPTEEEKKAIDKTVEKKRAQIEADPSKHGIATRHSPESRESQKAALIEMYRNSLLPEKAQRWIHFPRAYDFQSDPGKAGKYDSDKIALAISRSQTILKVSGLLSKAIAQAKAQGTVFERWQMPIKKPGRSISQMAEASEEPFDAVEVYSNRSCFAIYVARGDDSGFESTRKDIRPDLGSARLFPDEPTAERYAKARGLSLQDCAIVAVDIAPASFKAMSPKGKFPELLAVIAAKEALEIEGAIKNARIEALEAELASRRQAADPTGGETPKGSKTRL